MTSSPVNIRGLLPILNQSFGPSLEEQFAVQRSEIIQGLDDKAIIGLHDATGQEIAQRIEDPGFVDRAYNKRLLSGRSPKDKTIDIQSSANAILLNFFKGQESEAMIDVASFNLVELNCFTPRTLDKFAKLCIEAALKFDDPRYARIIDYVSHDIYKNRVHSDSSQRGYSDKEIKPKPLRNDFESNKLKQLMRQVISQLRTEVTDEHPKLNAYLNSLSNPVKLWWC